MFKIVAVDEATGISKGERLSKNRASIRSPYVAFHFWEALRLSAFADWLRPCTFIYMAWASQPADKRQALSDCKSNNSS